MEAPRRPRHRTPTGLLPLGLLFGLFACGGPTTPGSPPSDASPVIRLDKAVYRWDSDSVVRYTVTNPHGADIWIDCPGPGHQAYREGWDWIHQSSGCLDIQPLRALAGDSLRGVLGLTSREIPVAGHYRLVFELWRDPHRRELWTLPARASASFWVGP